MKFVFKIIAVILSVFVLILIAQSVFKFSITDGLKKRFNRSDLTNVRVSVGEQTIKTINEIAAMEIFHPKNLSVIEIDKKEYWRLNIGTVFVFVEYDSYVKLGVKDPDSIQFEVSKDGKTVYVNDSSIVIDVLDYKVSNFNHIKTFTSNIFVQNRDAEKHVFQAINELEAELKYRMIENGQANFEFAKKNFKENWKSTFNRLGLNVVYR
ncbi:MAG: hypothetical protein FWB95_05280 [Treponema sp.]|nr:hypothetical protein [Treponema sp.]